MTAASESRVRVVIVDDHPVVRAGLRHLLATQPDFDVVGEAEDGRTAIDLILARSPDVALLDLQMPGLGGVGVLTEVARHSTPTALLVLTTYDTDADIFEAIDAGAAGYLLKDTPAERLFEAIRAASRGEPALAPRVAGRLMAELRREQPDALTQRELDVLVLAADGHTNRQIARRLHIGEATVKSHLVHVYRKLDVDDRTHAVTVALHQGLIRLGGREPT